MFVALKLNSWQAIRAPSPFAGMQTKCLREDQPPGVTHHWAVRLQERDEHLWRLPIHRGSCPNCVSSCHLLENRAPALGSWWADLAIPVWCSHPLPGSRLSASLRCGTRQLLSQVFLQTNSPASLQRQLCRFKFHQREKKKSSTLRLSETSAPFARCVSVSVTFLVCGVAEIPPRGWHWWLCCHFSTRGIPHCGILSGKPAFCTVSCILLLSYYKFLHGSSSRFTFPPTTFTLSSS